MLVNGSLPVPPGLEMLVNGSLPVPPGLKMLVNGSLPVPPGLKMLVNGSLPVPPGLKMLVNGSLPVPPGLENCSDYTAAWRWLSALQPGYLGLVALLGLLGNGLVLWVFCLQRRPCSVADVYLGNLAAADLVLMCCLPFWAVTVARGYHWAFGEPLCKLVNVAVSMNYMTSMMFLMLVSLDRYLALVRPLSPSRLRRPTWAKRMCVGVWGLGLLFALPVLLFRTVLFVEDAGVDACILAYPDPAWRLYHNTTRTVLGFLLPGLVVAFCTWYTVAALQRQGLEGLPGIRAERRATHLVLAVLLVFLICWTPHQVMQFLDTLDYFELTPGCLWGHVLDVGIQLSTYLAYSHSAVNPFLFAIVGTQFRRRAREALHKTMTPVSRDLDYRRRAREALHKTMTPVSRDLDYRRRAREALHKTMTPVSRDLDYRRRAREALHKTMTPVSRDLDYRRRAKGVKGVKGAQQRSRDLDYHSVSFSSISITKVDVFSIQPADHS